MSRLLIFFSCCTFVWGQTTIVQGPSSFLLGSFNNGDQVSVQIQTSSCDPNESGENEPVVIRASTGDLFVSIGTYGTVSSYTFKATAAGTLTGQISGSDTNPTYCGTAYDELAVVTVTIASNCSQAVPTPIPSPVGCPVQGWTRGQKIAAGLAAVASAAIGGTMNIASVIGLVCGPAAPACVAALSFGGVGLAAANGILGVFAGVDPPDPNFTLIAKPLIPTYTQIVAQLGITSALATALNALNINSLNTIAYAQAAITSGNRAQGAANASNAFWESAQFQAEENYASILVSLTQAEPGLLANLQNALVAGGYGSGTVTTTDVLSYETSILQNGLPTSIVQVLTQAGVDNATINLLTNFIDALDVTKVAGAFPAQLTNPTLVGAINNFVNITAVDIAGGIVNPLFAGTTGSCPTGWICSGSPAPGFASYAPTTAQYPGGSPFPTSAFSPTIYGGSGVIRQLTSLTWVGGNTYILNLSAGLPNKEPDGTTPVAGWPRAPNGAARLYLTMGDGFGQVAAFDIPSPSPGTFISSPIAFMLPSNSGAIGQKIGVMIYVSAPSSFSANFAITPIAVAPN